MLSTRKDPYYSKKDTLRWHEANFQIIQVFSRNSITSKYYVDNNLKLNVGQVA